MRQSINDVKETEPQISETSSTVSSTTYNTIREALPGEKDLLTELRESIEPTDPDIEENIDDWPITSVGRSQPPPYSVSGFGSFQIAPNLKSGHAYCLQLGET